MAKVIDIFKFLKDFNELSNPVITEIDKQKWYYKLSEVPRIKEIWSIYDVQDFDELKILEVKRPELKPCPHPSESIIDWIEGDWKKLNVEKINYKEEIIKEIETDEGENRLQIEDFFDDEDRVDSFEKWV